MNIFIWSQTQRRYSSRGGSNAFKIRIGRGMDNVVVWFDDPDGRLIGGVSLGARASRALARGLLKVSERRPRLEIRPSALKSATTAVSR